MGITKFGNNISDFRKNMFVTKYTQVVSLVWAYGIAQLLKPVEQEKGTSSGWWLLSLLNSSTCDFIRGIEMNRSWQWYYIGDWHWHEGQLQKVDNVVLVTGVGTADTPRRVCFQV